MSNIISHSHQNNNNIIALSMTEIRLEPAELIYLKLQKIRCSTGCLKTINYLVFGYGLYCSQCLSSIPDINEDHFINLEGLAKILVDLTQQYQQKIKGQTSQLNVIKGEMQGARKQIKKLKDGLSYDLKSVKQKSFARLEQLFSQCLKQNQNEPLQAFYEPDITATLIINQSQLLMQNLKNLKITKGTEGGVAYNLKERKKNPEKINKKVSKQYQQLNKCIQLAMKQIEGTLANFMKDTGLVSVQNK